MVNPAELKFMALTEERRKEVVRDNLNKAKMGAWWRMIKPLMVNSPRMFSFPRSMMVSTTARMMMRRRMPTKRM
jgi:hypothetical protein